MIEGCNCVKGIKTYSQSFVMGVINSINICHGGSVKSCLPMGVYA